MRTLKIVAALGLVTLEFLPAAIPMAYAAAPDETAIDKQVGDFFDLLKSGKSIDAVNATLGRSPLMTGKEGEQQALASQIDGALRIYGPMTSYEKVTESRYGTMVLKRFYVAQHEKMLTRWELVFSRLKSGWVVTYLGFDDQFRTWDK